MAFAPGNKHGGRPPAQKDFAAALRIAVTAQGESGQPKLRELAEVLVKKALEGESWAMQQIADRIDGKPAQESTLTIDDKRDATDWTRDELVAFLSDAAADSVGTPEKGRRGRKPGNVH